DGAGGAQASYIMSRVVIAAIVYFASAVVLGGVSASALAGRLPRNRWVGLRSAATLRDEDAFRAANRVAAPAQAGAAVILVLGAIGALLLDGGAALATVVVAPIVALVLMAVGAGVGQRVAHAMPAPDLGPCSHSCGSCSLQGSCETAVH